MREVCEQYWCNFYNPMMEYNCSHGEAEQSCIYNQQPEETMSDKIQMTEENFIKMMLDIGIPVGREEINKAKQSGYIIKPEIEQLLEEWEVKYTELTKDPLIRPKYITIANDLIQLLKPYYYNSKEKN